jgi:hypothetical protein
VAWVLRRASLSDSAEAVEKRSTADPRIDPTQEIVFLSAAAHAAAGDKAGAIARLKAYLAANPAMRAGLKDDSGWWFRSLDSDPDYLRLVGRTS